jgi:histidine triad (HIT) family protein
MASIFTKIINREIPAAIVYEDEKFIAFMDAFPQMEGHMLVCPKQEVDYIFDLDTETYTQLFAVVKQLAPALKTATNASRICLMVEGYGVPHVHVHMLPTTEGFGEMGPQADLEVLTKTAENIKRHIS